MQKNWIIFIKNHLTKYASDFSQVAISAGTLIYFFGTTKSCSSAEIKKKKE